jgi:amidohydrolase
MEATVRFPEMRVRAVLPRVVDLRRRLHATPELGLELPATAALVEAELRELGLAPRRVGCGMWVDIGRRGPLVAVRADMDALPVEEKTGLACASTHLGRMHACGHDCHTAALLGAARLAAAEDLPYRLRLVFQTGEEGHFGALPLIDAGVLDGVSAIVAGHVGSVSADLQPGQAGFLPGPMMAAADRFQGCFTGSGGHGSEPHATPDPISALAEYIVALNGMRAREMDQTRPSVVSVCAVHAGATHNVIPERAEFMGTARSIHADVRARLAERIAALAEGVARMRGLSMAFEWMDGYPPVVNDPDCTALAMEAARSVLGPERVVQLSRPVMGGEDFAYYLEKVPGCFWLLNTQAPERGIVHPNHNPRFDVDEDLLWELVAVNLAAAERMAAAVDA